jgi:hypothetical protein
VGSTCTELIANIPTPEASTTGILNYSSNSAGSPLQKFAKCIFIQINLPMKFTNRNLICTMQDSSASAATTVPSKFLTSKHYLLSIDVSNEQSRIAMKLQD